jgi:hypothetical protein
MDNWRKQWKVHPSADVFPMISGKELAALVEDIKKNGLLVPYEYCIGGDGEKIFTDGRNRMSACEKAGVDPGEGLEVPAEGVVGRIISKNILRRHLTRGEQVELMIAARKAGEGLGEEPGQGVAVSKNKGGRGKKNKLVDDVVNDAKAAGMRVSRKTVQRAAAKAAGRTPPPKKKSVTKKQTPKKGAAPQPTPDPNTPEPGSGYSPGALESMVRLVLRDSDPVELAVRIVRMMDREQLKHFRSEYLRVVEKAA